jgi:diguanylate cyclase (GGDEF)-like protein
MYLSWIFLASANFSMQFWQKYVKTNIYLVTIFLVFSVALSAVVSLFQSVENQSFLQQQSLTPAFDLITQEIFKPLYTAETIARASPLKLRMNEPSIDQQEILAMLDSISKEFDMEFFVASENSRMQYNSNGTTQPLNIEDVEWYFRAQKIDQDIIGALGNRENIHIYFDIKVHNDAGEFLGFIGVGRKLESFITSFESYKIKYGYDFILVDHNDNVVLSSDPSLLADGKRILKLQQLPWFKALATKEQLEQSSNNLLVNVDGDDFLIAKAHLKTLNWKLFLVNPLKIRQDEAADLFIIQTVNMMFLLLCTLLIGRLMVPYIQGEFARRHQNDPLTQLPNRAHLTWRFNQISKSGRSVSAIMIDIDHFKIINDTHGHDAGDRVLREASTVLLSHLRKVDIAGRWGGEEFVILLPSTDHSEVHEIAERTRLSLSGHDFVFDGKKLNITASFGIAVGSSSCKLEELIKKADDALYQAKRDGRNTVRSSKGPNESE